MRRARMAAAAACALTLAACAGTLGTQDTAPKLVDSMAGRWILTAPNAPSCGMNFGGAAGAREGKLVPEGGCPDKFYQSKSWTLDQGALTIKDDEGEALAQLKLRGNQFEGESNAGTPLTLAR